MMIGTVMFLGGFCASLLAFYGRNAPLLMLAAALLLFNHYLLFDDCISYDIFASV